MHQGFDTIFSDIIYIVSCSSIVQPSRYNATWCTVCQLRSLPVSRINTSSVWQISSMFLGCGRISICQSIMLCTSKSSCLISDAYAAAHHTGRTHSTLCSTRALTCMQPHLRTREAPSNTISVCAMQQHRVEISAPWSWLRFRHARCTDNALNDIILGPANIRGRYSLSTAFFGFITCRLTQ